MSQHIFEMQKALNDVLYSREGCKLRNLIHYPYTPNLKIVNWGEGGCAIVAKAMHRWLRGDGTIYCLQEDMNFYIKRDRVDLSSLPPGYEKNKNHIIHVVNRIDGMFFDHVRLEECGDFLRSWPKYDPRYTSVIPFVEEDWVWEDIQMGDEYTDELYNLICKYMGNWNNWKQQKAKYSQIKNKLKRYCK